MGKMVRIGRILEVHPADQFYEQREELIGNTCTKYPLNNPDEYTSEEGFECGQFALWQGAFAGRSIFLYAVKIEWITTFPEEVVG